MPRLATIAPLVCGAMLALCYSAVGEPLVVTISPNLHLARVEGFHLLAGHPPLIIDFSAHIEGAEGATTCLWDFDGNGRSDSSTLDPQPFTYASQGVYKATVTVRDNQGQVATAEQRIVVIGAPEQADWRFGLVCHLNRSYELYRTDADVTRAAGLISDLGVDVVRLDLAWSAVQPTPDEYHWEDYDYLVSIAEGFGFELMPIIGFSTRWASSTKKANDWTDWFFAPPSTHAYAWFAYQAASRYAGRVRAWEIWNEPNAGIYWRPEPDPARYTELLKNAYLAIKYAAPSAVVVLGGLANDESSYQPDYAWYPPEEFLRAIYDYGGSPYFDVVSRHPYTHPSEGVSAFSARLRSVRLVMEEMGEEKKPIWLTEIGYAASSDLGVTESEQSRWLVKCLGAVQQTDFVSTVFWYNLRDTGSDPSNWEQNLGLIAYDWTIEPDFLAYQALIAEGK